MQETSAERITGRVGRRTSGENAIAGRLERKGRPDRTESPCLCGLLCGDVDQLNGEDGEDDDKGARPHEERVPCAIETAEADRVVHYFPFLKDQAKPLSCASRIILAHSWAVRFL